MLRINGQQIERVVANGAEAGRVFANGALIYEALWTRRRFGTLYVNGTPRAAPQKPWRTDDNNPFGNDADTGNGDIYDYTEGDQLSIGNTVSGMELTWIAVEDAGKRLFICDRVICVNTSMQTYLDQNLHGKDITIDGKAYRLRMLTGGTGENDASCEYNRFLLNTGSFPRLPVPEASDRAEPLDNAERLRASNQMWNWAGVSTFCYPLAETQAVRRGGDTVQGYSLVAASDTWRGHGWRPVLEQSM